LQITCHSFVYALCRLELQKLPAGAKNATVSLELAMPDGQTLDLAEAGAPVVQVLSGPPHMLKATRRDIK
jgi:hypothetical protein